MPSLCRDIAPRWELKLLKPNLAFALWHEVPRWLVNRPGSLENNFGLYMFECRLALPVTERRLKFPSLSAYSIIFVHVDHEWVEGCDYGHFITASEAFVCGTVR